MFSPPYISQGEELSSDNRKQVLREGEALGGDGGRRGGQRENRGLQVCRTEETGDERRGGIVSKKTLFALRPDYLKWKFLRRGYGALHS